MTSSLCFSQSVYRNLLKTTYSIKTLEADTLSKALQNNMQIWKPCDKKWRHNVITKNNGKMRTSAEPSKIYIVRKVLMRAIQKCNFYWIWVLPWPLTKYGHVTWPWLQISKIFIFFPNSILNFSKVTKFGENWLKNKKVTGKKQNSG